ncbi:MAG: L-histidine N(alpha)-methyltransferase [Bacteroidia bacterium]
MSIDRPAAADIHLARDIRQGLGHTPKRISSKYFYDDRGSELFRQIMRMEAYYPTRCEYEIFDTHRERLRHLLAGDGGAFQLIEFGAGDGLKTKLLLGHLLDHDTDFSFSPIDISGDALRQLHAALAGEFPRLRVRPIEDDYFRALQHLHDETDQRKVVLFLGSNIGNFTRDEAVAFLGRLHAHLRPGDRVLIGFDLKKDPAVILRAYDDEEGITRAFNLNLLDRLNRELGADFDPRAFRHWPTYDPATGETRSYLVSTRRQTITFAAIDYRVTLQAWEPIWLELSQKYDLPQIEALAQSAGFDLVAHLHDSRRWFVDSVWEKGG